MVIEIKNNKLISLSRFNTADIDQLLVYLQNLSTDTKKRFGPHEFHNQPIIDFYNSTQPTIGYIARDNESTAIIAYAVIRIGYLDHDQPRLQSYGLSLSKKTDTTFAPSVADNWQGYGIGNRLFRFIVSDLRSMGINRMILWGGVQADNDRAVHYYHKLGFQTLGRFEYNGDNFDMFVTI